MRDTSRSPSHTARIRVLVVDDHPIYARGIMDCLSTEADIECVGIVVGGTKVLETIAHLTPDVVMVSALLASVDVPALAHRIRERFPQIALIALCDTVPDHVVIDGVRAGIDGYLLKGCNTTELVAAIRVVHQGESYLPPPIASRVIHYFRLLDPPSDGLGRVDRAREQSAGAAGQRTKQS